MTQNWRFNCAELFIWSVPILSRLTKQVSYRSIMYSNFLIWSRFHNLLKPSKKTNKQTETKAKKKRNMTHLIFTTCSYYYWSKSIKWYNLHYIERQSTNIVWGKTWLYLITRLTMKLHSIEGKFNSSVFVSEEFLTIMRNWLYRDLTISSFDCITVNAKWFSANRNFAPSNG